MAEARARARELPEVNWHEPSRRPRVREVVVHEIPICIELAWRSVGTSPSHSPASPQLEIVGEIMRAVPAAIAVPP